MGGRLLVLDDDEAVGATIAMIAQAAGFETALMTDADEFLHHQEEWHPTHIALDLIMPKVDGVEILIELARRGCDAKIIITSGAGPRVLEAARRTSLESGLNVLGILSKPFKMAKFHALLDADKPDATMHAGATDGPAQAAATPLTLAELKLAIEQRQLFLVYQPKIRCSDGQLGGIEALVRWCHPTRGEIPPIDFIPLAESGGLIEALTDYVFETAMNWFAPYRAHPDLHLAVNLSALSLTDQNLPGRLFAVCEQHDVNPGRIVLEVTETAAMADPATTLGLATRLRLKGFQLSMDDFGIGYSSLAMLARLPFSELKVDRSFVQDVMHSEEAHKIVSAIIGLGHSLGLQVTAEGVGDAETLAFLKAAGCDLAQGYFISRPMTAAKFQDWAGADTGTES